MRQPRTAVVFALLVLLVTILSSACRSRDGDDDRPPIIVSTGSVIVDSKDVAWTDEGSGRYRQKESKGKSVKSFSATTGACVVAGEVLVVTYGTSDITLSPKRRWWFVKKDAQVEFPAGAVVNQPESGRLVLTTADTLVRVANENGVRCDVVDQRIEIRQVH